MGRRRQLRIERSRHLRVGASVAAGLVVLAGAILILASTFDDGEAAAGTPSVSRPTRAKRNPALLLTHSLKKTVETKRPPSPYPDAPKNSGAGRRIVYCISCQQVWLVQDDDDYVFSSYRVSGRRGFPRTGTYKVIRRVNPGVHGTLRLPYFVGFTFGNTTDVGFHGIPLSGGRQIQSDAQLGTYRSSGCVRENQTDARRLWDFAPMGTKVVVIP